MNLEGGNQNIDKINKGLRINCESKAWIFFYYLFYHVYLENITILEPQVGKRKMNLVPHLQQVPKKWPGCGARRRREFFMV